ncbi:hypothetical protein FA10DRAFT_303887 [Acaromyces ingoldii]|uniref:N-acetyltransferase domain-containing protein n=1 Tax=Acaromyces ingoldii TaxID=215250 RepID=A0A316YDY5_9BASI|nr:hypothetical protein FA10DRAFT_303887 [Acaromyces ingoldii]PWN87800.1 hypothetical protein FA10DRAFT_303887 [Acaromyces ingoldii]
MTHVREVREGDLATIASHCAEARYPLNEQMLRRMILHPQTRYLCLVDDEDDERILCSCVLTSVGGRALYLAMFVTPSQHRRRGYGVALIRWLLADVQQSNDSVDRVFLGASPMSKAIFEREGFVPEEGSCNKLSMPGTVAPDAREGFLSTRLDQLPDPVQCQLADMCDQGGRLQRWSLYASILAEATVHILFDQTTERQDKVVAWLATRPDGKERTTLGPLMAYDVDVASRLVGMVVRPLTRNGGPVQTVDAFTDPRSNRKSQLQESLLSRGWQLQKGFPLMTHRLARDKGEGVNTAAAPGLALHLMHPVCGVL